MKNLKLKLITVPKEYTIVTDNKDITVKTEKDAEIMIGLIMNAVKLKEQYHHMYRDVIDSSKTKYKGDLILLENISIKKGLFITMGELTYQILYPIPENILDILVGV